MSPKFRSTMPEAQVYIAPNMPALRPGQRTLSVLAREREDAEAVTARVRGYPWHSLISSGPHRTSMTHWTFILNAAERGTQAEKMARLRAQRAKEKKCWECPAPAAPGRRRCERCLKRKRDRQRRGP